MDQDTIKITKPMEEHCEFYKGTLLYDQIAIIISLEVKCNASYLQQSCYLKHAVYL